jgi:hypothetical protein
MDPDLCDLLRVVSALPCAYSRRAMVRGLQGMAGKRVYIAHRDILASDEVSLAVSLLETMARDEARDALMARLQCRRSKAYRLIRDALRVRGNPAAGLAAN